MFLNHFNFLVKMIMTWYIFDCVKWIFEFKCNVLSEMVSQISWNFLYFWWNSSQKNAENEYLVKLKYNFPHLFEDTNFDKRQVLFLHPSFVELTFFFCSFESFNFVILLQLIVLILVTWKALVSSYLSMILTE